MRLTVALKMDCSTVRDFKEATTVLNISIVANMIVAL